MSAAALVLVSSVILQVVTRLAVIPFSWTEEVARYAFVWIAFLGTSFGIANSSHIRLDMILNMLSPRLRIVVDIFQCIVMIGLWGLILYVCFDFIEFSRVNKAPALNVTILVRNLSAPVGGTLCLCRLVQAAVKDVMALVRPDKMKKERA